MDGADYASNDIETHKNAKIQQIRRQATPIVFTGFCRFCGDEIEKGGFCDTQCRHKFNLKQRG